MKSTAGAFLLAAGHGRRSGGPKAWATYRGQPLLQRQLTFLGSRFESRHVFVAIQPAWSARCVALNDEVQWIAVDPDAQAMASVLALARHASTLAASGVRWYFLHHVDMPLWEPDLYDQLDREVATLPEDALALVPTRAGRGGHPVLLSQQAVSRLTLLDPHRARLDHWLHSQGSRVHRVPVPFDCVLENWNHLNGDSS